MINKNIETLKKEIQARKDFLYDWKDIEHEKRIEFQNIIWGMEIALNIMQEKSEKH